MRKLSHRTTLRTASAVLSAILVSAAVLSVTACQAGFLFDIWDELLTPGLDISPSAAVMEPGQHITLKAMGGREPYTFTKTGGLGTLIDNLDGTALYTAPVGSATDVVILLTDSRGEEVLADITVSAVAIPQLYILPSSVSLAYSGSVSFGVTGGSTPYTFTRIPQVGTLTDNGDGTADYTAPASDADVVVQVEDGSGQAAQASVTVRAAPPTLAIVPAAAVMEEATNYMFTASGGTPPYMFSASGGSITDYGDGTADFTAPAAPATVTVTVTDSLSATADSVVTVVDAFPALAIVPRSINVTLGSTFQFEAEGGDGSYAYAMGTTYGGTVTPAGLYTAPTERQGVETVVVTDGRGITDTATVKVKKK